jgi:hypothetical protein
LLGKARVEFPAQPAVGRIGATDPWFEFAQGKLISAHVGVGLLRRQPARRLGMVPNYQPYYAERYDGAFNSEESLSGKVSHTFLSDVNSGS